MKKPDFSLTPSWPEELPTHCPTCGRKFDIRGDLEIGPNQAGRALRKFAPWMTMVMLGIMFATKLSFFTLGGWGGAMAFAAALVVPSIVLWIIGGLLPTRARLSCFKCSTTSYHRLPVNLDNRVRIVTE